MNRDARSQGRDAERTVERFLRRQGYAMLARNLLVGRDELDLVMRDPDGKTVVLVEVKSSTLGALHAQAALDAPKRSRLARALRQLEHLGILAGNPVRLDGVLVDTSRTPPGIHHLVGSPMQ
jgi:Holliday junction resolvase-like predicted endonuclease